MMRLFVIPGVVEVLRYLFLDQTNALNKVFIFSLLLVPQDFAAAGRQRTAIEKR